MTEDAAPIAEATVVALVGVLLMSAGVVLAEWPAAVVGLVLAVAGLTVRGLAIFKA